ncbi:MAG: L-seryl-tRNA(Sec) selenium transferase [Chloroflexi bacterium]|nr:L-seryl-tRNA(Sec) selenium transferase [Chloroflexota bacterium]
MVAVAANARSLPSVDELLRQPALSSAEAQLGHDIVLRAARLVLAEARAVILSEGKDIVPADAATLADNAARAAWRTVTPSLTRVINATGVVIHTNLGRVPLSRGALEAMASTGAGYSTLEFNLASGGRGDRQDHIQDTLRELLGVEGAVVVNNNASAVLLALTALARGKEVVISRSQAVEIGGGFRIPDVMRRSGAKLVEVGTTNRTYLQDYQQAIGARTAMLLRVHSSNFRVIGFTHTVEIGELGELSQRRGVLLADDLGSGALLDTRRFGLMREPTVQDSVAAGADVICFSGDKLLGGPQAGIIAGKREAIERLKRDPLMRAMRTDKVTMAGLQATLLEYLMGRAEETLPVWQMIAQPCNAIERRAKGWAERVKGSVVIAGRSAVGGGSLPEETLPTVLLALPKAAAASKLLARLRKQDPPVIGRIQDGAVVLDPRTVQPDEDEALLHGVEGACSQ